MVQGNGFCDLLRSIPRTPTPSPCHCVTSPCPSPQGEYYYGNLTLYGGHTCLFYVTVMNKRHKIHDFQGGVFLKKQRYFTVSPFYFLLQQEAIAICVEIC
jgi:hypothetical protein